MQIFWKFIRLISGLFFAVTCFIGFIYLMFVNLSLSERLWPGIVGVQQKAGRGNGASILAFIIACPIPIGACVIWYKTFKWLDDKLKKLSFGDKEIAKTASVPSTIGSLPPQTSKEDKLGASLAVYAGLYGFAILMGMIIICYVYSFFEKIGGVYGDALHISIFTHNICHDIH